MGRIPFLHKLLRTKCQFESFSIGEPVSIFVGHYDSPAQFADYCFDLRRLELQNTTVVCHLPINGTLNQLEHFVMQCSDCHADCCIITGDDPIRNGSSMHLLSDLQPVWKSRSATPLLQESNTERAVVGAMMRMREGDSLVLLWPDAAIDPTPSSLIGLGRRWRSSMANTEEGVYHRPALSDLVSVE